jgi:hypothetical protein
LQNYFNYFTEIEERFQQRRGSLLLLSTLDWALIETWREAGVPLEAVLRGIDATFDKRDAGKAGTRKRRVNGLAWCAQAVMDAAESIREASVGAAGNSTSANPDASFAPERIAAHFEMCASQLQKAGLAALKEPACSLAVESSTRLRALAAEVRGAYPNLEELERTLTVMEEKLLSMLIATASEQILVELREQAARELAPYRSRMQALQIRQIEQQFLHKRLLERYGLPRLSLFYMNQQ